MRPDVSKMDLPETGLVSATEKSVLLITPDAAVKDAIQSALTGLAGVNVRTQVSSLAGLNGKMAQIAADKDIIIFETSGDDARDIEVIRALSTARRSGAKLLALADSGISLSRVRALNNAGVDEVLPSPVPSNQPAAARLAPSPAAPVGRLIAVAQARGGVGATTVAVNLADELVGHSSLLKRRLPNAVALVDLDLQFGSVGALLDLGEQDALMQLALDGAVPDAAFLEAAMVRRPNGMRVLAAPSKFMPLDSLQPEQIATILDLLRRENDFVVVDLPHALGQWIEPVLKRADELLIVSDTSVPSIRHCRRLIDFFTADNPDLPVRIVINHEKRSMFNAGVQREAQKALNRKLDCWLPHDPQAARASADRGQPLSTVAPRSQLGRAISRLARDTIATFPVTHISPTRGR